MSTEASTDKRYLDYCQGTVESVRERIERSRQMMHLMMVATPLIVMMLAAGITLLAGNPEGHGLIGTVTVITFLIGCVGTVLSAIYWLSSWGEWEPVPCEAIIASHCQSYEDWSSQTERADRREAEVLAVAAVAC
jgi:hypothetical protein